MRLGSTKEINNSTHLMCQLSVSVVCVFYYRIKHDTNLLGKHIDHFVVAFIHLLPHKQEGTSS